MSWKILLALSIFANALATLLQKVLLDDEGSDPLAQCIVFQLLGGAIAGLWVLAGGWNAPPLGPILPNLALSCVIYAAGGLLAFRAMKAIDASDFAVLCASSSIWSIAAATLFLGERISGRQAAAAALILASVVLVVWKPKALALRKGELLALAAAMAFGLAFANDAFVLRSMDVATYLVVSFIGPALGLWLLNPGATRAMRPLLAARTLSRLALFAAVYIGSIIALYRAYQTGRNAAEIAALHQTSVIASVLLAVVFLRERDDLWRKLLGGCIAVVGAVWIQS